MNVIVAWRHYGTFPRDVFVRDNVTEVDSVSGVLDLPGRNSYDLHIINSVLPHNPDAVARMKLLYPKYLGSGKEIELIAEKTDRESVGRRIDLREERSELLRTMNGLVSGHSGEVIIPACGGRPVIYMDDRLGGDVITIYCPMPFVLKDFISAVRKSVPSWILPIEFVR